MTTVGERIKQRRLEIKMSADLLAEKLGKNRATIYRYEKDEIEDISINVLGDIARILNVDPVYLMGYKDDPEDNRISHDYTYLPTAISAGLPIVAESVAEYDVSKLSIPDSIMGKWAGNKDIYILKVNGDSMDKLMPDSSLIAVKPTPIETLKNGDIVVFSDNHDYSVKRYYKQDDKLIFKPESTNLVHYDQTYSIDDNITIHGKVVVYIVELD